VLSHWIDGVLLGVHEQFQKSRRRRVRLNAIVPLQTATTKLIRHINNGNTGALISRLRSSIIICRHGPVKSAIQIRRAFLGAILHHRIRHHLVQTHRKTVISAFRI
jgi:hypothetical protein